MKKTYLILAALVALLIWFQIARPSVINRIRPRIVDLAKFPLKIATKSIRGFYNLATFQNRYEKEIALLENKIALLTRAAVESREVLEENQRLRSLLAFKGRLPSKGIAAEVIARDPSSWDSFIIIDKGKRDGITPDMLIAKGEGLIGRVLEVGQDTSKVMLIDNPNSKIAATVQRTREQGVLVGLGGGFCKIIYLAYDTEAKPGDIILTSESSHASVKGIVIGEITKVLRTPRSLYISALVKPSSNLFKVEEVLCIE